MTALTTLSGEPHGLLSSERYLFDIAYYVILYIAAFNYICQVFYIPIELPERTWLRWGWEGSEQVPQLQPITCPREPRGLWGFMPPAPGAYA